MDLNPIDVQRHLKGVDYPARRGELVRAARDQGASDDIVSALEGLDDDEYSGPDQVMAGLDR